MFILLTYHDARATSSSFGTPSIDLLRERRTMAPSASSPILISSDESDSEGSAVSNVEFRVTAAVSPRKARINNTARRSDESFAADNSSELLNEESRVESSSRRSDESFAADNSSKSPRVSKESRVEAGSTQQIPTTECKSPTPPLSVPPISTLIPGPQLVLVHEGLLDAVIKLVVPTWKTLFGNEGSFETVEQHIKSRLLVQNTQTLAPNQYNSYGGSSSQGLITLESFDSPVSQELTVTKLMETQPPNFFSAESTGIINPQSNDKESDNESDGENAKPPKKKSRQDNEAQDRVTDYPARISDGHHEKLETVCTPSDSDGLISQEQINICSIPSIILDSSKDQLEAEGAHIDTDSDDDSSGCSPCGKAIICPTEEDSIDDASSNIVSGKQNKRRRRRCRKCVNCLMPDCMKCNYCL